jgi:hypothetical protein
MLNLVLNLRKYNAYKSRNQFNAGERLAGALAYPHIRVYRSLIAKKALNVRISH